MAIKNVIGKKFFEEIENLGNKIVEGFKDKLKKNKSVASKKLLKSIDFRYFQPNAKNIKLKFNLKDYWKYVEHGRRKGKQPPQKKIKGWIKDKNINTGNKSLDEASFLIARKIGNEGTKAQPFVEPTLKEERKRARKRLGNVVEKNLKFIFNQTFKNF